MNKATHFAQLVDSIQTAHRELAAQASKAVNISLTLRNWLIGCYITEYELNGKDRAEYGEKLFTQLAKGLKRLDVARSDERELRRYRQFIRPTHGFGRYCLPNWSSGFLDRQIREMSPRF